MQINNNQTTSIEKFNLRAGSNEISGTNKNLIIGSGLIKEQLIEKILNINNDIRIKIAVNTKNNNFFNKHIRDVFIHDDYDKNIMDRLFTRQNLVMEKNKTNTTILGKRKLDDETNIKNDPRVMLVMDNYFDNADNYMSKLIYNACFYKIGFIFTIQYSQDMLSDYQSGFDYIFILPEQINDNKKLLFNHYFSSIDYSIFEKIFDSITGDNGILVINNKIESRNIIDKIQWYKINI